MASLQEFINKNNGKALDFDGYYGAQCVDLIQFWSQNLGSGRFNGATALVLAAPAGWSWHANTPSGVPPEGAVVKYNFSPSGHVSIARAGGNTNSFPSFDQNWNNHHYCELVNHDYAHVIGWWTKDGAAPAPTPPPAGSFTVRVDKAVANVRVAPQSSAALGGSQKLTQGQTFQSSGLVDGESVSGNNKWYKSTKGNYVWSGGLSRV